MIEPQVKLAARLWTKVGLNVLDEFESKNWKLSFQDITDTFNEAFWCYDIRFFFSESPADDGLRRYVEGGLFHYDGLIEVFLTQKFYTFLQKLRFKKDYMARWINFGKNLFLEEYLEVVSHELLHRKQWELGMRHGVETASNGEESIEHFSDYTEIQAHAQDTALNILINRSLMSQYYYIGCYNDLFGNDSPIYKTFMKNLQRFLGMMIKDQIHLLFQESTPLHKTSQNNIISSFYQLDHQNIYTCLQCQ